ncbi:MAG: carbohydrate ABC transporter permease [Spirochaetes bacterium]|nr:MAG: carbohydrate ABC transporter permease [Spirochaetota bacterium]
MRTGQSKYCFRYVVGRITVYSLLFLFAVCFLVPVYVLLATGLKSFKDVNIERMWVLPDEITMAAFGKAFSKLSPNFINSIILTIPATVASCIAGSLNGYIFSKWRFKGADIIFVFILFGMFIPYQSILIPLVQFLNRIGLYGSLSGLIVTHIVYGLPITTLIFRNYYMEVPDELLESAQIDGLGMFNIYFKIVAQISAPAFVVAIIWQFTNIWNEFLFAVIITQKPSIQPITVALQNLAGSQIVEWNVQMAGALLAAMPTLLVYILLGRFFIRGLMAGSVKG